MPSKLTQIDFVRKAREVHGNKYSYDKFIYLNTSTAGTVICKTHGKFLQKPEAHLQGRGCYYCNRKQVKPQKKFIKELQEKFGRQCDYSHVVYKGVFIPVKLICKKTW